MSVSTMADTNEAHTLDCRTATALDLLVHVSRAPLPVGIPENLLEESTKGALTWGFAVHSVSLPLR